MPTRASTKASGQYELKTRGAWHIVTVKAPIDSQRDLTWLQTLAEELCQSAHPRLALMFDKKSFLHSKLIAALVACSRIAKSHDGVLALLEPGTHVVATLKAMKLVGSVVQLYASESDLD